MVTQKTKEKLFRITPNEDSRITNIMIQYAYKAGYIAKPSFQDYMMFATQCAEVVLKQDWSQREQESQPPRRRPIV